MNPQIIFAVVKGLFMLNTRDKFEAKTGKARPKALSRRAIHTALASSSLIVSMVLGVQIPEVDIMNAANAVTAIVDTFEQNKALVLTAWSSIGVLVGYFRRKK